MRIDFYNDLKKVANRLGIGLVLNNRHILVRGDFEGDLVVMSSSGRVPQPIVNILTLKYEKGAIRSVTRNLTITEGKDEVTNLYVTENYTQEWRFKEKKNNTLIFTSVYYFFLRLLFSLPIIFGCSIIFVYIFLYNREIPVKHRILSVET